MDRLDAPARLMVVSDLDHTMVDSDDPQNHSLLRFNALWEFSYRRDSLLIYSTGRPPVIYRPLRKQKPMLTPDITILSVGTEIYYGESMLKDYEWEQFLNLNWDREIVVEETKRFSELKLQREKEQTPLKVSFFMEVDEMRALEVIKALYEALEKRGLNVKLVYSSGRALDVLPKGGGKGEALAYLLRKFEAEGKRPLNTLVCGDSGNDAELFTVPGVYGVMVSNAKKELLQWYSENAKDYPRTIHSTERCASGIIHAIGYFSLGPNVSPRDITDFKKYKMENFGPAHEVVKFYLFYERWRRAEIEKSVNHIQNLRSVFIPKGTYCHPSGFERLFNSCIDELSTLYSDMQGTEYRVWVDRVSYDQIGSDTWLVKFYKWELSRDECACCLTTILLSSKAEVPQGFTWKHMQGTWVEEPKDPKTWVF